MSFAMYGVQQQQHQQQQNQGNKQHNGLLSRFFGSLRRGVKTSSASGPAGVSSASFLNSSAICPSSPVYSRCSVSTAAAATAVAMAPATLERSSSPWLGFPTNIEEKYSLGKELGKGGNGVVRVATCRETGEEFACKSIRKVLGEGVSEVKKRGHLDSLRREIQVMTKLNGSLNIVKLEDVYEDEDCVHIIMEWCKGGELWHRIGDRHYSERTVASFMRAVLRTLAQCHAQHILHRDIKPGNFMLLSDDERAPLKAIDFGLAAPFDPNGLPRTDLGLEGTPWYMAPETLRCEWLPAGDVWAAGVMAFQLLCGRFPFDDRKCPHAPAVTAVWRSVLNDPLEFDPRWWAGISEEARDFCRLLLQRDPAKRPTAKEALKHPWLQGTSAERSTGKRISAGVVARIQRFAAGSQFKRSVLQHIAAELLAHPHPRLDEQRRACSLAGRDGGTGGEREGSGRPVIAAPDAACLQPLLRQLQLEGQGAEVTEERLGEALASMGFKLAPSEVSRLMEQIDLADRGAVDTAAFAASQMDWARLQRDHKELWMQLAEQAFRSLDKDGDGVLMAGELLACMRARLPAEEVAAAVAEALEDARSKSGQGQPGLGMGLGVLGTGTDSEEEGGPVQGIDLNTFMSLLKVGSLDSLDLYDDRMGGASNGGTVHGAASVDRLNNLLAASLHTGDWSRHGRNAGIGGSLRDGVGGSGHGSRRAGDLAAVLDNDKASHAETQAPPGIAFRFDVKEGSVRGSSLGPIARAAATAGSGAAAPAPAASNAMVWRFDVGGPKAPPPPPAPVFRFDVAGAGSHRTAAGGSGSAKGTGVPVAASSGAAAAAGLGGLGRQGGYYDRRHHGSDLYSNVALKALAAAGVPHRLDTVDE